MIITRSPLRISLGGGGTDLPSYYSQRGGFLVAAAINKYVYIAVSQPFTNEIILKYSSIEKTDSIDQIKHNIFRSVLKELYLQDLRDGIEISSIADIPSGTGLGSSGSFTTALVYALKTFRNESMSKKDIAEFACKIEIDILKEPIGKQDQYIAAFGGIRTFDFHKDGSVSVGNLKVSNDFVTYLNESLLIFFTGYTRDASTILATQNSKSLNEDKTMLSNLDFIKDLGHRSRVALEAENLEDFGLLLKEHWNYKKQRSSNMTNKHIDEYYQIGLAAGAIGGKLIGAGGGSFLMFLTMKPDALRKKMKECGIKEVRYAFDMVGTSIMQQV